MSENFIWTDNPTVSGVSPCDTDVLNDCLMYLRYQNKQSFLPVFCFNSGNVDDDGDADILYAEGVQTIPSSWTQPTLAENGTLGNAELAVSALNANSGDANTWKLFDGSTTETSDSVSWQQPWTGNDKGFVIFSAKSIKIESLTVYQDSYCVGNFDLFGSLDGENWTQIGSGLTFPHVQHATETCTVNSPEFYNYHKIIFTAGYNTSGGKDVIRTAEWSISAVYENSRFTKTVTFKIGSASVLSGTKTSGETVELTALPDIDVSAFENGTFNVFVDENGAEPLKNTVYRQKAKPSANLGDIWLDTSKEPLRAYKAVADTFEVKSDADGFKKVEDFFHSSFDVSKFVLTGEPTISANGIASGFSTGNFPRARVSLASYDKWVLKSKIKTGENAANIPFLAHTDAPSMQITFSNGKIGFSASSDGATWNLAAGVTSTAELDPETEYFVRIEFTGTAYVISASTDDETYSELINVESSAKVYNSAYLNIGTTRSANVFFNGAFDLKYFNIYGDGALVFSGNETATDTVGTVNIPYVKALSGEKIVSVTYRPLVQQVAASGGSAEYYTIDELQKTYSNPVGIAFSSFDKIPLGNFVVQNGLVKTYSTFAFNQNGYSVNANTPSNG
ncbi:MAG: hypothetical protein ACI4CY_08145 [Candidatus Gastranaerophilaceae bacterium]